LADDMFLSYIEDYANNSAIMKITDKMQKDVSTSVVLLFSLLCDIFVTAYAVSTCSCIDRVTTCQRSWRHRRLETERWPPL